MLNPSIEKKNDDRLIIKREVFAGVAATSPFESTDDIVLSGSMEAITKGSLELRPRQIFTIPQKDTSFKERQIQDAKKELIKFPNNPFVLNNLGLAYLNNAEIDKAIETFKQAQIVRSDLAVVSLNLAATYLTNNQDDLAFEIYCNLKKDIPNDARVLVNIANIHFKNKRLKEAKEIYKQIIKDDSRNIASINRLALIHLIEGQYDSAISELRKCLSLNINLPAIYNNLGIAYGVQGLHDKAKEAFGIALKLSPNYINAVHNMAETLKINNNIAEAIEILERYLEINENNRTKELLARCYLENKQFQKSLRVMSGLLKVAEKLKARKEKVARLHNNIGVIYHAMGDFDNAESNYFTCIEKVGYNNDVIVSNIIDLYLRLQKIEYAKKYIDILQDKFGTNNLYFYYLSLYAFHNAQLIESVKAMREFLKINKRFSPAYSFLSFIFSEYTHEYKKAVALNKEAIKYLPKDVITINNLAYNYLMNNEIKEAKKLLAKERNITENIFIIATLGLLRIKEGNIEDGKKLYDEATSMAINKFLRKQIIQKKHIELARYYLLNENKVVARQNLNKALLINIKDSIYAKQAEELLESIK